MEQRRQLRIDSVAAFSVVDQVCVCVCVCVCVYCIKSVAGFWFVDQVLADEISVLLMCC